MALRKKDTKTPKHQNTHTHTHTMKLTLMDPKLGDNLPAGICDSTHIRGRMGRGEKKKN